MEGSVRRGVWALSGTLSFFRFVYQAILGPSLCLGVVFMLVTVVFEGLAIPGLLKRSKQGWDWIYYSVLVNSVYMLVSFNIVGLIVGALLGMYLLFQVKSYYK